MEPRRAEQSSHKNKQQGIFGAFIHLVVSVVLMSFLAWFFLGTGFGLYQWIQGEEKTQAHMNSILAVNTQLLKNDHHFLIGNAYEAFGSIEKGVLSKFFMVEQDSDAMGWINENIQQSHEWIQKIPVRLKNKAITIFHHVLYPLLTVFLKSAVIVGMRLFVFLLSLPLFVLFVCIGCVDGLVQRDIRKFQAARESTYIFHRIKRTWKYCFFVPLFLYFVWPCAIHPAWFLVPMAVILSWMMQISLKHFKKYV